MTENSSLRRKLLDLAISGRLVPHSGEWRTVKLGEVAEIELGKRICKKTDSGKPYRFLANINVRWGEFDLSKLKETLFTEKEASQFSLKDGDLLVCEGGVPGRCAIWDRGETDIKYQMALHRVRPGEYLAASYLRYYLEAVHKKHAFTKYFIGCTISHLTKEILVKMPIKLPPIGEQKAIVKRLEELLALEREIAADSAALDDLIAAAKKKILSLAISGKLVENKGVWKTEKLGSICSAINGLWKGKDPPFENVGVIRAANFTKDCELILSKTVYIDVEAKKYQGRKLIANDLIVERSGGGPGQPVGRVVIFPAVEGEYSISNFTSILRVDNTSVIDPRYLQRCLVAIYNTGYTEKIQTQTTNLHNLNFKEYLDIDIPIPPIAEQKAIVSKIDELFSVLDAMKCER